MYTKEQIKLGNERLLELANKAEELTDWNWNFKDTERCLCDIFYIQFPNQNMTEEFMALEGKDAGRLFFVGHLPSTATKEQAIQNVRDFVAEREKQLEL